MHQNWWRDYDPSLGRYIQADPIGLDGGSNLYGYANADPLRFTDPDGRIAMLLPALGPWLPAIIKGSTAVCGLAIGAIGGQAVIDAYAPASPDAFLNEKAGDESCESCGDAERNPKQDKKLTPGEIKKLKEAGLDPEAMKGGNRTGRADLYKDSKGNIFEKPRGGDGPGEPTGININEL